MTKDDMINKLTNEYGEYLYSLTTIELKAIVETAVFTLYEANKIKKGKPC